MSGGWFKCWFVSIAVACVYMYILGRNSLRLYRKSSGERFFHSRTQGVELRMLVGVLTSLLLTNIIVESGYAIEQLCRNSLSGTIVTGDGVIVMMLAIVFLAGYVIYQALLLAFIAGQDNMADKMIGGIRKANPYEARELRFKYLEFSKDT